MSLAAFNSLMNHEVILKKMVRSYEGVLSVNSSQTVFGCVQFGNHLIKTDKDDPDETLMARAIVFFKDDITVDVTHENWEIEQLTPIAVPKLEVIKIDPICDEQTGAIHHYEMWVV